MTGETAIDRKVLRIGGSDRVRFLQGLVTSDIRASETRLVWTALLTPQGKYLADFFVFPGEDALYLDVHEGLAQGLAQRLAMYRLRSDVDISASDLVVLRGTGTPPPGALSDPRHEALGWRMLSDSPGAAPAIDWDAIRVAHCIPESLVELRPNETFILEAGFERLSGVDFRKGCYVGQEVTARMKHKTELRKGLGLVEIDGETPPPGTEITADGRTVGQLFTRSGNRAIAHLRFDRATGELQAGAARVRLVE